MQGLLPQPSSPEVWTRQEFTFDDETIDSHEGGHFGVPEDRVPAIAAAILDTLAHLGIDPLNVYLSGHNGLEPNPDGVKVRDRQEREEALDENQWEPPVSLEAGLGMGADLDFDHDDTYPRNPEEDEFYDHAQDADLTTQGTRLRTEDALLASYDEPEKPFYYMSIAQALFDRQDANTNPIHYAGISPRSTIVVYNKQDIIDFDTHQAGEAEELAIEATEADLAIAVLARIRLRYRIPGHKSEAPPIA